MKYNALNYLNSLIPKVTTVKSSIVNYATSLSNSIVKIPLSTFEFEYRYLTKIACRRILRGDANRIMRIHNFLESEGVINFGLSLDGLHNFKSSFISKGS